MFQKQFYEQEKLHFQFKFTEKGKLLPQTKKGNQNLIH